ncbi:hypothetical protein Tco_0697589 [Tanacetum coccineum]
MSSNSDDIQAAGSDTRPPMLDRTDYESWSQRIRLDALGTTPEGCVLLGPERPRTYEDLSDTEKKRYDADVRATNIVREANNSQGLKETNHEQLYAYLKQHDKHAAQDQLIIERIPPATNDKLAFVSTVQPHAQSSHVQSHQYPSSSTNPQSPQYPQFPKTSQINSGYTQTDEILDNLTKQMALLAQSFRATLPQTNNQLQTSSNTRNQATIQDGQVVVQNVPRRL